MRWKYRVLLMLASTALVNPTFGHSQELSEQEWERVDRSIDRASRWIASTQQRDGSFPTVPQGQPAVTSFGVLALLAQGHLPDRGEYGKPMSAAIRYVLSTQKTNGLVANVGPSGKIVPSQIEHSIGRPAAYNHAISSLMLSEAFATTDSSLAQEMQQAIDLALKFTFEQQKRPKREVDRGGWRYLDRLGGADADLSLMGWQLMFLRSAKNSGFDVPKNTIDEAVECVRRHYSKEEARFSYTPGENYTSRAMTGAGILAFAHAGLHRTEEARVAGETMLSFSFANYNRPASKLDRYHYSVFQCTQAAYQLEDEYWNKFYPPVFRTLLNHQSANGSWARENTHHGDGRYGSVYTTSLVVLSLCAPNQLLPIFQR